MVALVARELLLPDVRGQVDELLRSPEGKHQGREMREASMWADRLRDLDIGGAKRGTREWHFINIELASPDPVAACGGQTRIVLPAYPGSSHDCVTKKIEEFAAELRIRATSKARRMVDLRFLLHLVADVHQPLHAADNSDRGGNAVRVVDPTGWRGTLHAWWDTRAVDQLGSDPKSIATALLSGVTISETRLWQSTKPTEWALQAFQIARDDAYGKLPTSAHGKPRALTPHYVQVAAGDVALQLQKAGARLAGILNAALHQHR